LIGFINGGYYLPCIFLCHDLGMAGVVTGAIIVITHGNVTGKVAPIMTRLIARPLSPSLQIPNAVIIWVLFGVLMWLLLERTTFGRHLFAIGVNRITAKLSGVNVTRTNLSTYSPGALAGFGGFAGRQHGRGASQLRQPSLSSIAQWRWAERCSRVAKVATGNDGRRVLTLITSPLKPCRCPIRAADGVGWNLLIDLHLRQCHCGNNFGEPNGDTMMSRTDINFKAFMSKTVKLAWWGPLCRRSAPRCVQRLGA
jgi:ribose transport system permease protein